MGNLYLRINRKQMTFSLGLAYAGSDRKDVIEILTPVLNDVNSSFEVYCCMIKLMYNCMLK